jgi:thiol:disulfide interchange protein DsbD
VQADVVVSAMPGPAPDPAMPPLGQILVFAFLGGLILNLMPCVFPILAMKAVALAGHAGRGRAHAVSYTAGVLVTFVALALGLLATRAAGTAAGWGFQFSSPVFVAGMAWLLFAVGLNLSGVFQVGGSLAGAGGGLARRQGITGSFFTGLLAVLVATPCTAPFMGVAVAAGLAAPPVVTVLVFAVMGLGLAAPYVALASLPGLVRIMPRPGHWMETLKQALAFPMYGAAAWLVWVISQEAGPPGVLGAAAGLVLVGFAGWVFGATQASAVQPRRFGQAMATIAVLAALAVLSGITAPPVGAATEKASEAYTPERLAALRAEGRPVFINMTAAWCVTCLLNERVAISTDAVQAAFATGGVAYLKGDWTRQDPAITAFLRQNGRDGVPLYVFYPAGGGRPLMLPQILTEGEVLRFLRMS